MSNKNIALVTGGTGGIGTAICQKLTLDGFTVVAASSSEAKAKRWEQEQKELGFDIQTCVLNVVDFSNCTKNILYIEEVIGPISVLVNTAGITQDSTIKRMSKDQWQNVIDVNLTGTFNMCRNIIEPMLERKHGRIINISSINGEKGQFGQVNYAASKAGIHGITMSLAQEVASKGITVNTISPGYVLTPMVAKIDQEIQDKICAQIPVGRMGQPAEIGRAVAFLADEQAGYITGSNLSINGGQHMH